MTASLTPISVAGHVVITFFHLIFRIPEGAGSLEAFSRRRAGVRGTSGGAACAERGLLGPAPAASAGALRCWPGSSTCTAIRVPRATQREKSQLKLRLDNRESSCSEVCSSQQPWGHLFFLSPTQLCNRALCCETNPAGRLVVVFFGGSSGLLAKL